MTDLPHARPTPIPKTGRAVFDTLEKHCAMAEPSDTSAVATGAVRQAKPVRWRRIAAAVICAGVLFLFGPALYKRLTWAWYWADDVWGFVGYGTHEDEFSPDATQIAVAYRDQCKVLDLANGKELTRLKQYDGRGLSAFSSDGRIVSRFPDKEKGGKKAYLWSASDGRILGSVNAPENVNADRCYLMFTPDNKRIIGACADGLLIWDSLSLKYLGCVKIAWPTDSWLVGLLSWNPATQKLTGIDASGKLLKIDLDHETTEPFFAKQEGAVRAATWSPDGTRVVMIGREDGSVTVWDAQVGKVVAAIQEKEVLYARFSPDGKEIVTGRRRDDAVRTRRWAPSFWDRSTRIWDTTSGSLLRELPTTGIVTFSPDWSFWVETGPEGLRITGFDGSESCYFPQWFDGHGSSCRFAHDNTYLASVNGSGRVAVWRHHDPARSWMECLIGHEFWMSILALVGLAWALSGLRRTTRVVASA
jgi:WD40 repeat protein